MAEDFLSGLGGESRSGEKGERQSVRLMAIGSREGIQRVIHQLHNAGFAEAGNWSEVMREPQTGEWMSIMTKWVWME